MMIYFDPFAGISGDMTIGALLDAGLSFGELQSELGKITLTGYTLSVQKVLRAGISATKFDVHIPHDAHASAHAHDPAQGPTHGRSLSSIGRLIADSTLSVWVKEKALRAFTRLGEVEAQIHNQPIEEIHFHEVGAIDAIVDIVGTMIGLEKLGIRRFYAGPVNVGHGTVKTEHGLFPIPAPATAALLREAPTYANQIEGELTTPTGAALLATLVETFGPQPRMRTARIGYGAGTRTYPAFPNALRVMIGELDTTAMEASAGEELVAQIEANMDDMSPQLYGYIMEKALQAGALDVFLTPIQMKKNRPGVLLTILSPLALRAPLTDLLFQETTTIGVRYTIMARQTLTRIHTVLETPYGAIRVKVARTGNRVLNFAPEFDDCRAAAERSGVPLKEIFGHVNKIFLEKEAIWKTQ